MRYARALFSTDRLAHGAAELPRVISLHGQNFRGRADLNSHLEFESYSE